MCGIVGFFDVGPVSRWEAALATAVASLTHRGPDDCGSHLAQTPRGTIGLGHRRLSIRDLSPAGRQPLFSEDGQVAVVCNGEIYNDAELRAELEGRGHRFSSQSDNEVLIHGFEEYGPELLPRLDGMFAFALWDGRSGRLWLGRDRLGIKPLLYARTATGLVLGSEIHGLADWPGVSRRVSLRALHQYLTFGYALTPLTLLADVQKVRPGHLLCYDPGRGTLNESCYWSLEDAFRAGSSIGQNGTAPEGELWSLLSDSVHRRQVADVPLGSFLSGGVDSTAISAVLGRAAPGSQTFCCDFPEDTFSEAREAQAAARSLGLEHASLTMALPTPEEMPALVRAADEPLGDSSFLPYYRLSQFARQRVTVALSGDGADELMAGYLTYRANGYHRLVRRLPGALRGWMARSLAPAIRPGMTKVGAAFRARQFLAAADTDGGRAHALWRCLWLPEDVAGMLPPEVLEELRREESDPLDDVAANFRRVGDLPFLQQALYVDLSTWLLDDILPKVDRASMAHALEVRVPFLDHRFVEWCAGLPPELKLRGRTGKWILRRAARRHVPGIRFQRRKQGFNSPVGHWLNGAVRPWAREHLEDGQAASAGWLRPDGVHRDYWQEHRRGAADHGFKLWSLVWLMEWMRQMKATV